MNSNCFALLLLATLSICFTPTNSGATILNFLVFWGIQSKSCSVNVSMLYTKLLPFCYKLPSLFLPNKFQIKINSNWYKTYLIEDILGFFELVATFELSFSRLRSFPAILFFSKKEKLLLFKQNKDSPWTKWHAGIWWCIWNCVNLKYFCHFMQKN